MLHISACCLTVDCGPVLFSVYRVYTRGCNDYQTEFVKLILPEIDPMASKTPKVDGGCPG